MLFTSYSPGNETKSLWLEKPGTTWAISSSGASNPRPKDSFFHKMGMKYVENFKSGIFWYNMYQVYVKHAKP